MFSIGPNELLLFFIIALLIAVVWTIRYLRKKKERELESVIISIVRSQNGATIDDIIINVHVSADKAGKILRKLVSQGILKIEERDGKTYYVIA